MSILGEPLGATILAVILLQELPALLEVFGGILIIAGILMIRQQGSAQDPQESEAGGTEKSQLLSWNANRPGQTAVCLR